MHGKVTMLLVLCLVPLAVHAGDTWPCWRGPTGQGITDEKDLPTTWGGKDGHNVLWQAPLPGAGDTVHRDHNQSSPIVWKDRVFLIAAYWPRGVATTDFAEHHVACYRTSDGKQLWDALVAPGPWKLRDLRGGYAAPTPCTDGARVYVLFGSSVLAALDAATGKLVWRQEIAPFAWDVCIGTSPILYQDTVLVLVDGTQPKLSRLIAFDRTTGAIRWQRQRPTANFSHSTPLLIEVEGKAQLIVAASGALQALDPRDGAVIWQVSHKGDVPTPVFADGLLYSEDGRGGPGIAVTPGRTAAQVLWKTKAIPEGYSSPIRAGDYLYRSHNPGVLKCFRRDGELIYSERLPGGVDAAASPLRTPQGNLYFASGGKSVIVPAGPTFRITAVNDLGDPSRASPAVCAGRLYLKGSRFLWCIGKKDP